MLSSSNGPTAIVLVNYNGWLDTIECIVSLMEINQPIGIFVVDNDSPDGSEGKLAAWAKEELPKLSLTSGRPPLRFNHVAAGWEHEPGTSWPLAEGSIGAVTLVQAGRNGGFAAGTNIGLRFALKESYDFFWLLNNDTIVYPDTLDWLLAKVTHDAGIGMCGSTLLYFDRPEIVQAFGGAHFYWWKGWSEGIGEGSQFPSIIDEVAVESKLSYVNGASLLVTRSCLNTVGLLEESYFLYWEEIDWAFRMKGRFRLALASRSLVRHKVGASIGTKQSDDQSPLADFYLIRNGVLFCLRFSPRSLPFVIANLVRTVVRRAVKRDWPGVSRLIRAATGGHFPSDRAGIPRRSESGT